MMTAVACNKAGGSLLGLLAVLTEPANQALRDHQPQAVSEQIAWQTEMT